MEGSLPRPHPGGVYCQTLNKGGSHSYISSLLLALWYILLKTNAIYRRELTHFEDPFSMKYCDVTAAMWRQSSMWRQSGMLGSTSKCQCSTKHKINITPLHCMRPPSPTWDWWKHPIHFCPHLKMPHLWRNVLSLMDCLRRSTLLWNQRM